MTCRSGPVIAIALCWIGFACSAESTTATSPTPTGGALVVDGLEQAEVSVPLGLDPSRSLILQEAMQLVIKDCMDTQGFDYKPTRIPSAERGAGAGRARIERSLLFGLPADTTASVLGVVDSQEAFDREVQETLGAAASAQPSGSATAAYQATLNGTGEVVFSKRTGIGARADGCLAEGYRTVFGEPILGHEIEFLPSRIRDEAVGLALGHRNVAPALDDWRTCMADRGFDNETPSSLYATVEAVAHPDTDGYDGPERARKFEADATKAMIECDRESGLYQKGWDELPSQLDRALADNAADVEAFRQAVETATTIVRDGGT